VITPQSDPTQWFTVELAPHESAHRAYPRRTIEHPRNLPSALVPLKSARPASLNPPRALGTQKNRAK
jgi:hypothetical protein